MIQCDSYGFFLFFYNSLQTPLLPNSVEALNGCFNIGRNLIESNPYILDDLFFSKTTLVVQMNTLYGQTIYARRTNNETFDNSESAWEKENDIRERQRRLLTNFSMVNIKLYVYVYVCVCVY